MPLLEVKDLRKYYPLPPEHLFGPPRAVRAVDGVSFTLERGETVGLVGESGCGKSTMLKAVIGLLPVREGEILIENESIVRATGEKKRSIMRRFGVAFQGGGFDWNNKRS